VEYGFFVVELDFLRTFLRVEVDIRKRIADLRWYSGRRSWVRISFVEKPREKNVNECSIISRDYLLRLLRGYYNVIVSLCIGWGNEVLHCHANKFRYYK